MSVLAVLGVALLAVALIASRRGWAQPSLSTRHATPEQLEQQIALELAAGRKVEAIKLHRQLTGCDLKAAKDAIEARLGASPLH